MSLSILNYLVPQPARPPYDPTNPTNAQTHKELTGLGGQTAVFENDNYRISVGDNNSLNISNKHTGEVYSVSGDAQLTTQTGSGWLARALAQHQHLKGATTLQLDDGTKVTIQFADVNKPFAGHQQQVSTVTITNGNYGVQISGADGAHRGDLQIHEAKGWGGLLDAVVDDGASLRENAHGSGFTTVPTAPVDLGPVAHLYTVRSRDTLSSIAKAHGVSLRELVQANPQLANPDRISVGQALNLPQGTKAGTDRAVIVSTPAAAPAAPASASATSAAPSAAAVSGAPLYRQGDAAWADRTLGHQKQIGSSGCALTATAMAISKISGRDINPAQLDQYLDTHHGYDGDAMKWDVAAGAAGLHASKASWSLDKVNQQIDAGRPVVVGVDYKPGSNGGKNGTDHWIAVTGRGLENGRTVYYANDPANGKQIKLYADGDQLRQLDGQKYRTTGELVTFRGGSAAPAVATQPAATSAQPVQAPPAATTSGTKAQRWEQAKGDLVNAAKSAGVDAGIVAMIANFESGFNGAARPISRDASRNTVRQFDGTQAISSAYGYGQFTDDTWLSVLQAHGDKYGIPNAAQLTPAQAAAYRTDLKLQANMLAEFTHNNVERGRRLGGADDAANVYALHNLGDTSGTRFLRELSAHPTKRVSQVLSDKVIRNNSSLYGDGSITLQEAYRRMGNAMHGGERYANEARSMQNSAAQ